LREQAQRFQAALERTGRHGSLAFWPVAMTDTRAALADVARRFGDTKVHLQVVATAEPRLAPLGNGMETITARDTELIESTERLIAQLEQIPVRFGERYVAARALSAMQRITKGTSRALSLSQSDQEPIAAAAADQRIVEESLTRLELSLQARDEFTQRLLRQTQTIRDHYNAYLGTSRLAFEGLRQLASIQPSTRAIESDSDQIARRLAGLHATANEQSAGAVPAAIAAACAVLAALGAILLMRARKSELESARTLVTGHDDRTRIALTEMATTLGKHLRTSVPTLGEEPVSAIQALSEWASGSIENLRTRQEDLIACLSTLTTALQKSREDAISILEAYQNKEAKDDQVNEEAKQSVDRTAEILTAARESVRVFETIAAALSQGANAMHDVVRVTSVLRERTRSGEQRLRDLNEDLQVVANAMRHSLAAAEQLEALSANATHHLRADEPGDGKILLSDIERLVRRIIDHLRRYTELVDRVAPLAREAYDQVKPSISDADTALAATEEARGHFMRIDAISRDLMKSVERICAESKEVASSTVAVWEGAEALSALNARAGASALRIVESSAQAVQAVLDHLPAAPMPAARQAADRVTGSR
jgi:myosin heavy subunit